MLLLPLRNGGGKSSYASAAGTTATADASVSALQSGTTSADASRSRPDPKPAAAGGAGDDGRTDRYGIMETWETHFAATEDSQAGLPKLGSGKRLIGTGRRSAGLGLAAYSTTATGSSGMANAVYGHIATYTSFALAPFRKDSKSIICAAIGGASTHVTWKS